MGCWLGSVWDRGPVAALLAPRVLETTAGRSVLGVMVDDCLPGHGFLLKNTKTNM